MAWPRGSSKALVGLGVERKVAPTGPDPLREGAIPVGVKGARAEP